MPVSRQKSTDPNASRLKPFACATARNPAKPFTVSINPNSRASIRIFARTPDDGIRILGFRQHQSDDMRRRHECADVIVVPGRRHGIDTYENVARVLAPEPAHEIFTCDNFGVRRHGVFQINDDAVGAGRKRLAESFRPVSRHEEEAALRGHFHFLLARRRANRGGKSANS